MDLASKNRARLYMSTPHQNVRDAPAVGAEQAVETKPENEIEEDLDEIPKHSLHTLMFRSMKKAHELFSSSVNILPPIDKKDRSFIYSIKARNQYKQVLHAVPDSCEKLNIEKEVTKTTTETSKALILASNDAENFTSAPIDELKAKLPNPKNSQVALLPTEQSSHSEAARANDNAVVLASGLTIAPRKRAEIPKPDWHAPWKLSKVISGHTGWVRSIAVEPGNEWFATGSTDRIIKIWDLATCKLKLSLTGHISPVRGLAVSSRQPYLFSAGEDKTVKCWDLEYNKVVRHYHGHLSAVYALALHPTLDVLVSAGRDSVARVWDMRSKIQIHSLSGHSNTVGSVLCEASDPQVITGSYDSTVRLWDLAAGKSMTTLTNHKKSVRAIVSHPKLSMFCSGSINSLKQWRLPEGNFIQNFNGHDAIINAMAVNDDSVMVSGADNGSMFFWDWRTGYNFQRIQAIAQPGSIESENGIFALKFDQSGSRLITGEADKSIKIYKEDETATEDSHPVDWKPDIIKRKRF